MHNNMAIFPVALNGKLKYLALLASLLFCQSGLADTNAMWSESYQLEAEGRIASALAVTEKLYARDKNNEMIILRLGWLNYLAKNYNESINFYTRAIEINADSFDGRLGLTLPLLAQARWREAAQHAQTVLKVAPWQYYAHVRLMACEENLGMWDELLQHAKSVSLRYPSDGSILLYLARAHKALGQRKQAHATYLQVLERFPANEEALDFIAGK
jgi:tetratricopeptide (TPR) repeat protein